MVLKKQFFNSRFFRVNPQEAFFSFFVSRNQSLPRLMIRPIIRFLEINSHKQQLCKVFGAFNVKNRVMVITEMDKGEEKLLAVAWTYLYSVGIQIVDSAKHLRDKLGYLGKFSLFECYSLFVLVNEAFGKNVFFLMILSVI